MLKIVAVILAILLSFLICVVSGENVAVVVNAEQVEQNVNVDAIEVEEDENEKADEKKFIVKLIKKETIDEIPIYIQQDYPDVSYGNYGTIASHGCGIVCLAMVSTYLTDRVYEPEELANQFGDYNNENGSSWILFEDSAEELGLPLEKRTTSKKEVINALKNGQVVISLQNEGLFTATGHFIVLESISEDGKIFVKDPNGKNYNKNKKLDSGFENGFTEKQIFENGGPYWIYSKKT